ncbi:MAG: hypothetical protein ACLQAT_20100 [Candidatus Binataceae bacterium]
MDNQTQGSQPPATPATTPTSGTPEVSRPFAIPPDMTASDAAARLAELRQDKEWFGRWMKSGPDSREAREFDALTRHAVGQRQPEAAKVDPTPTERALEALGPPPKPSDYKLDNIRDPLTGLQLRLDGESKTLVDKTLFPAAHALGLSQSDVAAIAMTVTKPMTYEQCDAYLHKVWPGEEFEKGAADFRAAMSNPQHRELLDQYEQLSNSGPLIAGIVAAYRRARR